MTLLINPYAFGVPLGPASLLNLSGRTYFGDMTGQAGNAAAFNNSSGAQPATSCAYKTGGTSAYAGVDVGSGSSVRPSSVVFQSSTTSGFAGGSISQLRWSCYGSNSLPANGTDGTLLGTSATIIDAASATGSLSVTNESFWRYLWFTSSIVAGSADDWILAEAEVTGWII